LIVHTHSQEALCERIKAHCQQKQWYGPDIDYLYRHASHHLDESSKDHDFRSDFIAPATEEQIRLSEERMGISFPPLLRMLYLRVADGGFGPGCGLRGIFSPGYGLWGAINWHHPTFPKTTFVDLEELEVRHDPRTQDYYYHGPNERPRNFLELCHFGCGFFSYLHTSTGCVYYVGEHRIYLQANSLEEWLELWLQGEDLEHVMWMK